MRVSEDFQHLTSENLADAFYKHIDADPDLTHGEILAACLAIIGGVIVNIDCPGCRRLTVRNLKKMLPKTLRDAMTDAAERDKTRTVSHKH